MALDRTWYNTLVDDDGSGLTGSVWDKADVDALMDATDAEIARLDPATSGQLKFPSTQVPSTDPTTLDDYREGLWTPRLGGSGGQSGQTYAAQNGEYTKIGSNVDLQFTIILSALGTITGTVQIQGLPFIIIGTNVNYYPVTSAFYWSALAVGFVTLTGLGLAGQTAINLFGAKAAATSLSAVQSSDLTNGAILYGAIRYRASV